jgi:hypothetical protein
LNPGRRGGKPATNSLSYGAAFGKLLRKNKKISAKESLGYYELMKHKPWLNKSCSELLDERKEAKLQWL